MGNFVGVANSSRYKHCKRNRSPKLLAKPPCSVCINHKIGLYIIHRTSEQRLALFDQQKASGLTRTEFSKQKLFTWQHNDNDGFVELTPQEIPLCQSMLLKKKDSVN